MYFYEMHCHTSEGSDCSSSTGEEMAVYYKSLGYDGIFITDHFFNGNSRINSTMPGESWKKRVEAYCKGFENAEKKGREIGLEVFFGFEFNYMGTEWLVYGLSKEWLLENEKIMDMKPPRFLKYFRESGGYVVQAHPFREAPYIDTVRILPDYVDGIEVFNAKNCGRANDIAKFYATAKEIPQTCGSDCHHDKDDNLCAMGCEVKINSVSEFFERLRNGDLKLFKKDERNEFHEI